MYYCVILLSPLTKFNYTVVFAHNVAITTGKNVINFIFVVSTISTISIYEVISIEFFRIDSYILYLIS